MYKRLELLLLLLYGVSTGFCIPLTVASDYIHHSRNNSNLSNFYRLPKSVIPQRYNLQLSIYIDENTEKDFTFEGTVKIEIDVKSPVQNITLHSKGLKILPRNLKLEKDFSTIEDFSVEFDTVRDFLIIAKSNGVFQKGSHILSIDYSGKLSTDNRGFFKSTYTNGKGEKVWMATTYFQPTAARRAMPCFDEPEYKAIFNVSVVHNKKYTAVFNSPVASISTFDSNERVITHFKETPRMSTYLLAFLISDFARISNSAKNFSVLARKNAIQNGSIALEFGEKVLKELENYTNVAFAIEKMDQAAVPIFGAAMENWGLVIYAEGLLLSVKEENIVDIIAHEFAHQWFGNLVSPKWWKYLWLNEGFATYFASYISDKINPEWRSIEKSVISSIQPAFDFDSGISSHPVNQDVDSPGEIDAIFDDISYTKGGAVIRMLQHFLTEPVFRKGLHLYLMKNNYEAVDSDDLFKALQEVVDDTKMKLDLKTIMETWIDRKGYPVLTVTRNYADDLIEIKQERFFSYTPKEEELNDKYNWYIPINYVTEENLNFTITTPSLWLNDPTDKISVQVNPKHWIIFNTQRTGFYRVNYDKQNWKLITDYLNSANLEKIHILNRVQLIDDANALAQNQLLDLQTLLHLTTYLKNEKDYIAWYPAFQIFSWLKTKFINTDYYPNFKKYVLDQMEHLIEAIDWKQIQDDKYLTECNRISIILWACSMGHKSCMISMHEKMQKWLEGTERGLDAMKINTFEKPSSPDPIESVKQIILCQGLQLASVDEWRMMLKKYNGSESQYERDILGSTLGCTTDSRILRYNLDYAIKNHLPFNDTLKIVTSIYRNSEEGIGYVLGFFQENVRSLMKGNNDDIFNVIEDIGRRITNINQLSQLRMVSQHIRYNETSKAIHTMNEAIHNIEWLEKNKETLQLFFGSKSKMI